MLQYNIVVVIRQDICWLQFS